MIPLRLIVEDEVLEVAALNGHQHGAVGSGDGGDHTLLAGLERNSRFGTSADANSATQAQGLVEARFSALGLMRIACRDQPHGLYRTDRYAFGAAVALFRADLRQKGGGGNRA